MIASTTSDISGLHLGDHAEDEAEREKYKEQPGLSMKQEELLAKVRKEEEESDRKNISLIVVGECYRMRRFPCAHKQVTLMRANRR
jgi:hypothetical protein